MTVRESYFSLSLNTQPYAQYGHITCIEQVIEQMPLIFFFKLYISAAMILVCIN